MSNETKTVECAPGEVPWYDAMNDAADELDRMHGGDQSYVAWLADYNRFSYDQLTAIFPAQIESAVGVLPLVAFKSLLAFYVAWHRHLHTLWTIREQLPPVGQAGLPPVGKVN